MPDLIISGVVKEVMKEKVLEGGKSAVYQLPMLLSEAQTCLVML